MSKKHRYNPQPRPAEPVKGNPIFGGEKTLAAKIKELEAEEATKTETPQEGEAVAEAAAAEDVSNEPEVKVEEPEVEMEPALRLTTRLGRDFWCCQQKIPKGRALTLRLSELSPAQMQEIEIKQKGKFIVVEESELPKRG